MRISVPQSARSAKSVFLDRSHSIGLIDSESDTFGLKQLGFKTERSATLTFGEQGRSVHCYYAPSKKGTLFATAVATDDAVTIDILADGEYDTRFYRNPRRVVVRLNGQWRDVDPDSGWALRRKLRDTGEWVEFDIDAQAFVLANSARESDP